MAEKFDSQQFRDELAQEIKEAPKEDRKDILEKAKENPDYWNARTEKVKEWQSEEEIDDGFGVLVKKKTLYHGSGISGIKEQGLFKEAQDTTLGSGVYCTSEAKDAISYAWIRSGGERDRQRLEGEKIDSKPVIYECDVENMKLIDLRKKENLIKILPGFKEKLKEILKDSSLPWYTKEAFKEIIKKINNGEIRAVKDVAQQTHNFFSNYIKELGYGGVVAFEGGEGSMGSHDTYLIFDPEKVKINQEHNIGL